MKRNEYATEEEHEAAIMEDLRFNAQRLKIRDSLRKQNIARKAILTPTSTQRTYSLNEERNFSKRAIKTDLFYRPIDSAAAAGN